MNIETANRLLYYRKKNNLSQEELAEKIGVSRQAVSKWERAEASPDTDNLIELSKIYGVTLDELINGKEESEEQKESTENSSDTSGGEPPKDKISFKHGIHVHSKNGDRVDIGTDGVHVFEKTGTKVDVGWNGVFVTEGGEEKVYTDENGNVIISENIEEREHIRRGLNKFPYFMLAILAYLIFGFFGICGGWSAGWIVILTIPLYHNIVDTVCKRDITCFAYPVLVAVLYLWLGMFHSLWHPGWIVFFTIPLWYFIIEFCKKLLPYKDKKRD